MSTAWASISSGPQPHAVGHYRWLARHLLSDAQDHPQFLADAGRELVREGLVRKLHEEFLSITGNGNPLENSRLIGREMAARHQQAGVDSIIVRNQYPQRRCDKYRVGKGWDSCGSSNRHDAGGKGRELQPHSTGQGGIIYLLGDAELPANEEKDFRRRIVQQALDALATDGWTTP